MAKPFSKLRALLTEHDYTQPQLARKLGIGYTALNQHMNGHTPWGHDEMCDIMVLFNVPYEHLHVIFPPLPAKPGTRRRAG
jgi:transcriptional regulator with XRE-family HTH domain